MEKTSARRGRAAATSAGPMSAPGTRSGAFAEKDAAGNAVHGAVVVHDGANNLLRGEGVQLCVAGMSDLIVVATPKR